MIRITTISNRVFAELQRISRHRIAMCLLAAALTMTIRIALLPRIPVPQPYVHDEFAYLLGAETFKSGRMTNPPHPMWEHFETFHELMQPTYMSKYPPGQSLFLALGWKLFGHPWFGVWIGYGFFCACLCWMLQNWVPPAYAMLGTAIVVAQVSIFGYWMNSYWGGAVAAGAGCLLLGTLPRLARQLRPIDVILASVGLLLLANTRPYEGLVMSAAAFVALLLWRRNRNRSLLGLLSLRCVIPFVLVFGSGMAIDAYYNYRVTGNPFVMPYKLYSQEYEFVPSWLIFPTRTPPIYRHAAIEEHALNNLKFYYRKERANPLVSLGFPIVFYFSYLSLFPIGIGVLLGGGYRVWTAVAISACMCCGLIISTYRWPHYVAGGIGLLAVLAAYGFRLLRVTSKRYGPSLVFMLAALLCTQSWARSLHSTVLEEKARNFISARNSVTQACLKQGGRQLILVRYAADHIPDYEYVFNSADIDGSAIVWARDMGEAKNQELIDYYRGSRKVWIWQPDVSPTLLTPYEAATR